MGALAAPTGEVPVRGPELRELLHRDALKLSLSHVPRHARQPAIRILRHLARDVQEVVVRERVVEADRDVSGGPAIVILSGLARQAARRPRKYHYFT